MPQMPFQFAKELAAAESAPDRDNVIPLSLSQCLNPSCLTSNPGRPELCQRCGLPLLLADRYRAVRTIGSGGFAATFQAVDEHRLDTPCVIKQFLPQQQDQQAYQKAIELFAQEAVLLRDLGGHPQIPELMAFLEQGDHLYIVQAFIEGHNLLQDFGQNGPFSEADIVLILSSLLPVLQFVHDHRVIHRDIKPSNIIRKPDGSFVLIDFGSSHQSYTHLFDRRSPRTATPGYAPPEQMRGKVFPNSDLFSLGLTCLRLMTGAFPDDLEVDPLFDEVLQQWRWEGFLSPVSGALRSILASLLEPDTTRRYVSAQAALADLTGDRAANWSIEAANRIGKIGFAGAIAAQIEDLAEPANPYQQLQSLLAAQDFRAADDETWRLLLAHSSNLDRVTLDAIESLPSAVLKTIDGLWQVYSQGRFGLTAQLQIYRELGGTAQFNYALWETFAARVGWYRDDAWLGYEALTFSLDALQGHLPACCIESSNRLGQEQGVCGWWRLGFVTLMQRL